MIDLKEATLGTSVHLDRGTFHHYGWVLSVNSQEWISILCEDGTRRVARADELTKIWQKVPIETLPEGTVVILPDRSLANLFYRDVEDVVLHGLDHSEYKRLPYGTEVEIAFTHDHAVRFLYRNMKRYDG